MGGDFASIRGALRRLRGAVDRNEVFGAASHRFEINPCVTKDRVRSFEMTHRVDLPADYRRFLIEVGNGGAGPGYGLLPLGEIDGGDGVGTIDWESEDGFLGIVTEPFPHIRPWNDVENYPGRSRQEDDEAFDIRMAAFESQYFDPLQVNGVISVCHLGCDLWHWLVVTGPEAGNIWRDGRAEFTGLSQLAQDRADRTTFLQWYRAWLAESLSKLGV